MYLKKFIYVNWGNIPNSEFTFGDINLFSGGNGSGKTTAADAIQTLMTAAHDGAFHFNPGQDESTQRGRGGKQVRTLASYVLGCDDGAYARLDGADAYLAGVFHPTPGESGEPFTAIIALRAFLESAGSTRVGRLEEQTFYIVKNTELALSDFEKADSGGKYIVAADRLYTSLRQGYSTEKVERYEKKKAYLARLYGALRGKRDAVSEREAMHAARAFSRFMAYKPVDSIDAFVASEVLDAKEMGSAIRDISSALKTIHKMEREAAQLQVSVRLLEEARGKANFYIDNWLQQQVLGYCVAQSQFVRAQQSYLHSKQEQKTLRQALLQNEKERTLSDERNRELRAKTIELEARRKGFAVLRDKDQLEQQIQELQQQFGLRAKSLLQADEQLRINSRACQTLLQGLQQQSLELSLPELADKTLRTRLKILAQEPSLADLKNLFMQDWVDISPLEAHLDQALVLQQEHNVFLAHWQRSDEQNVSLRDKLMHHIQRRRDEQDKLKKRYEQLEREVNALQTQQVSYPPQVEAALKAIRQQCPEADARVLCDHVEIIDPQWQSAIEGYIGGNRFGILVEEAYEAEAIRIVRNMAGRGGNQSINNAKVIQGSKARSDAARDQRNHDAHAICHVMSFTHATAEAYIRASYGNVLRVNSAEELRNTRRGVTQDGMASGNYTLFRCDISDDSLVFGQGARARALLAKRELLSATLEQYQAANDDYNALHNVQRAIDNLKVIDYADQLSQVLSLQRKEDSARKALTSLDLSGFDELEQALQALLGQEQALDEHVKELQKSWVNIEADLKNISSRCERQSDEQESLQEKAEACENNVRSLAKLWPDFDAEQALTQADKSIAHGNTEHFINEEQSISSELQKAFHQLGRCIHDHNLQANMQDAIAFDPVFDDPKASFKLACDSRQQLDSLHNRLKNNVLASRHQELISLRNSFNNSFVTHLCHTIFQSINDGQRTLEQLNDELLHHRFGADRERFYFGWQWVAEFKEYWQFFKAVMENPSLGEGESLFDSALDDKHCQVRDRLIAMLLDEDEQKALRELTRIADYRNYHSYEIYKEPEGKDPIALSTYGTGSGGQLETPAYIIRSAAITSAFRFNEGNSHLRMVLVDEAFSKMDEHRSKEVMNYLTQSLGLQLVFIMPSSKCGPFMDMVSHQYVFTKCPTAGKVPGSELNTTVLVDRQILKKDAVEKLWAERRRDVSYQASLDFMDAFME